MISVDEIRGLAAEWGIREDVVEKDYALGWLLAAISAQPELRTTWVFKGGTCLRKCYHETYRFSEDLDFTVVGGGPEVAEGLVPIFARVDEWLRARVGLELLIDAEMVRRGVNRRGRATATLRVGYRGPRRTPNAPKIKVDLTSDEVLVGPAESRTILHPYSDADQLGVEVPSYSLAELLAEKIRALVERCRPRDLYDVIHMYRHPSLAGLAAPVQIALRAKCAHAGIPAPEARTVLASPNRAELDQEWENMLAHQLPHLPLVGEYWAQVEPMFAWLGGAPTPRLARVESLEPIDPRWVAPRAMASWRGAPVERIRYAGSNRLKVEIDYRALDGRQGWRTVEPYALRQTQDGNVIVIVVNDRGQTRSYRTDRIRDVRISEHPFVPRYLVEF